MNHGSPIHRPHILEEDSPGKDKSKNPKPKRPLTAYNLFYKFDRERLLAGLETTDLQVTRADVLRLSRQDKTKPKRSHRKTHGKIGFVDLCRTVAARWKQLSPSSREIFENQAKLEKEEYDRKVEIWKLQELSGSTLEEKDQQGEVSNIEDTKEPTQSHSSQSDSDRSELHSTLDAEGRSDYASWQARLFTEKSASVSNREADQVVDQFRARIDQAISAFSQSCHTEFSPALPQSCATEFTSTLSQSCPTQLPSFPSAKTVVPSSYSEPDLGRRVTARVTEFKSYSTSSLTGFFRNLDSNWSNNRTNLSYNLFEGFDYSEPLDQETLENLFD